MILFGGNKYLRFFFLFIVLCGIGFSGFYYYEEIYLKYQQITENVKKIESIKSDVENTLKSENLTGDDVANSKFDFDITMEDLKTDAGDESISDIKLAYSNAVMKGDERLQLDLLEKFYNLTKNDKLAYLLFDRSLKLYDFQRALKYISIIHDHDPGFKNHDVKTYLYVLYNSLDFTPKNIKGLKSTVRAYTISGYITPNDEIFYDSLLKIAANDFDGYLNLFQTLSGDEYKGYILDINNAIKGYSRFKDTPLYYEKGLIAFVFFQHGYFSLAERLSEEILKLNAGYILPNQIIAYSSFIRNDFKRSQDYLKILLKVDSSNDYMYKLFLGMSYFWNGSYENAIIFLSQIKSGDRLMDVYRYLILSYYNISDYKNMVKYMKKVLDIGNLTEYDYYTFFDIFFYIPFEKKEDFILFKANNQLVFDYLIACEGNMEKVGGYICSYGKGGYYLAFGNQDNALKYLLFVSKHYNRNYIFQKIADIYKAKGDLESAKNYYIKAIFHTQDEETKSQIKKELYDLILKKDKK